MAFKGNDQFMGRYNAHQNLAKSRLSKTASMKFGSPKNTPSMDRLDTKNDHKPLPHQTAPGVNRNHTIQKDLNTGTVGAHIPTQNAQMFNKKTLQPDLHASSGGVHKPGAR